VYENTILRWDDGEPVSDEERARILGAVLAEAERRGISIEVE
jgi:hypothetical protein